VGNKYLSDLARHFYRVLRPDRHAYIFCDWEASSALTVAGKAAGFRTWTPLVWDKVKIGMGYHYRSQYELILFWEKGRRRLRDLGVSNVVSCPRVHGGYPTEKPQPVIEVLVRQSAPDEDVQGSLFGGRRPLVVDPFCGSGTTARAAIACGCDFAGCDVVEEAVALARQGLEVCDGNRD
jgi:site-specific DNA-methyltransferase (adenine-specific)